jgi:YegS/Rv2252/BmrU family lipid kinase
MIANPVAGRRIKGKVERGLSELRRLGSEGQLWWTECRGDGVRLARLAVEEKADTIIAAGGDGTVNEIINGMAGSSTALGVFPLGTTNCFGLEMGIPAHPVEAARTLMHSRPHRIHLGKANDSYFLLMAGAGFDAEVVHSVMLHPGLKRKVGKLAYILLGLNCLRKFQPGRLRLTLDNGQKLEGSTAVIGNTRYYAGSFLLTPDAGCEKEELDVCLFLDHTISTMLGYAWGIIRGGRHIKNPGVVMRKCRSLSLECDQEAKVQIDGDYLGRTPVKIEIVPRALTVLLPARDRS